MLNVEVLQGHLMDQLDRLATAKGDELKEEVSRAKAMVGVASQLNDSVSKQLEVTKIVMAVKGQSEIVDATVDHLIGLPEPE